jgi:hypothetical protein
MSRSLADNRTCTKAEVAVTSPTMIPVPAYTFGGANPSRGVPS